MAENTKVSHPSTMADQHGDARWFGPVPDPNVLKHYNDLDPGFAKWFMQMAQNESDRKYHLETMELEHEIKRIITNSDLFKREDYGLAIGLTTVIAGSITAILGAEWPGGFIGTAGVTGLVSVFIIGRQMKG